MGNDADTPDKDEPFCSLINNWLKEKWRGTATELCNELLAADNTFNSDPIGIKKKLTILTTFFKKELGISVEFG